MREISNQATLVFTQCSHYKVKILHSPITVFPQNLAAPRIIATLEITLHISVDGSNKRHPRNDATRKRVDQVQSNRYADTC